MAIALAAQASKSGFTPGSTLTIPITVPEGNDRFLAVGITIHNSAGQTITGVTYAGTALSNNDQAGTPNAMNVANGTDVHTYIWRLIAPVVGTNNIVITGSAAIQRYVVVASVWTGVHQTTALGTRATNTGSSTGTSATPTVDVSSASGEVVIDMFGELTDGTSTTTVAVGSGQTQIAQGKYQNAIYGGSSYEDGAGTVTMSWTVTHPNSVDHDWATVGVPLKPSTTLSTALSANTSLAEVAAVPWRKAPSVGFQSSATTLARENMQLNFEAAGMLPKVIVGTIRGDTIIWDDVWTVPSVAKAGGLALTAHPTPMTPYGDSLFVSTQDTLMQYPFPYSFEPHLTPFPQLAHSYSANENLTPVFYPSAVDFGDVVELKYLEVYAQNVNRATDAIRVGFSWDDTGQWYESESLAENYCMFAFEENFGRILRIGVALNDADDSEPTGPTITKVIGWWVYRPDQRGVAPNTRANPENA